MNVLDERGTIYAYAPAQGEPANQYTVTQMSASKQARTSIKIDRSAMTICPEPLSVQHLNEGCLAASAPPIDYTVRVPKQARLSIFTANGSIHATDVAGPVDARARSGDIKIQIPRLRKCGD